MRKDDLLKENEILKEKIERLEGENAGLKVSEQLFHALFEQAEGYSMILDPNTPDGIPLIKDANQAACDYHGYGREEFIGQPVGIVDDEEGKGLVKEHTDMIMKGESFSIENRHMRKDGSLFHVAVNARRINLEDRPPLILSVERDITERKEALMNLQESEKRFRQAIDEMPLPVMIHAQGGEVLRVNRMWILLTGYEQKEIDTINKWTERAYGERKEPVREVIEALVNSEMGNHDGEFSLTSKSGKNLIWDFYTSPIGELPDGRKLFLSAALDITEKKRMDEKIARLSRFPSENPNPVIRVDREGMVLYVNAAGEKVLPYLCEEKGKRLSPPMSEKVKNLLEKGESDNEEIPLAQRWFLFNFAPVSEEGYINIYGTDITESMKLREAVTHAEKMKAIGQLAGGIAHDYNNQLGALSGYLDLLRQETGEQGNGSAYIEKMFESLNHAKALTAQLLSFSRKGKTLHVAVDLNDVIRSICLILENSIDRRINVNRELYSGETAVLGDPSQIHNALLNIALNGRDAMEGGGSLSFRSRRIDLSRREISREDLNLEPGEYVQVTIADSGKGMKEEVKLRALEPFFTTKEEGKGTGMGLSAAYGALKAHRGDLRLRSEWDKGTQVDLYFPVEKSQMVKASQRVFESPSSFVSGEGKVLLVDDNKAIGDIGSRMLKRLGFDVQVFTSPVEGIEYFRENHRDIAFVVTDMIMPEMNGTAFFTKLSDIQKDVKVILTSGYSADGEIQELLDRGVAGFLGKPFVMADLSAVIEKMQG